MKKTGREGEGKVEQKPGREEEIRREKYKKKGRKGKGVEVRRKEN